MADSGGVRVTVTLTKEQDRILRTIAARNKVSVAWLLRRAVDQLVEIGDTPELTLDLRRAS